MLPELDFKLREIYQDELFFDDSRELARVLAQKNPVYLTLELPGMLTQVLVCFPAPCTTRIYVGRIHEKNIVGEVFDKYNIYVASDQVRYRYGMSFLPWMFLGQLDSETHTQRACRDNVVNYAILNSVVGHSGVLIRVSRKHCSSEKSQEWFEIYHFDTGNDYRFAEQWHNDPNTKMVARFVPQRVSMGRQTWRPENVQGLRVEETTPC